MSGLSLEKCTSNLKSVALTILELTTKNLGCDMTLATPPLRKIFKGHVQTVRGNMLVKFEVRSFNRFGVISI